MSCVYLYKNRLFNSEIELDDFLLDRKDLLDNYSDIIFNKVDQIKTKQILDRHYIPLEEVRKNNNTNISNSAILASNLLDSPQINLKENYIGLIKFLQKFEIEGKLLFPEFREDEYWLRRKKMWASYTEGADVNEFFTPEEIEVIFPEGNVKALIQQEEIDKAIKLITNKWKKMAEIGTEIHRIAQNYFSTTPGGTKVYEFDKNALYKYFTEGDKYNKDLIDGSILMDILTRCEELKNSIINTVGKDAIFLPELVIKSNTTQISNNTVDTIVGIIDLAVLDKDGKLHIYDYKTSPIPYQSNKSSAVKVNTYKYQLATYGRIINKYGIETASLNVVPWELTNFKPDENGEYYFDGLKSIGKNNPIDNLSSDILNNIKIQDNLDNFLPKPKITDVTTENMLQYVQEQMGDWFGNYNPNINNYTEKAAKLIEKVEINPDSNKWIYKVFGSSKVISADSKEELLIKVSEALEDVAKYNSKRIESIVETFKQAIKEGDKHPHFKMNSKYLKEGLEDIEWFDKNLATYCNGNWNLVDCPQALAMGVIIFENTNGLVDFIKISPHSLNHKLKLSKGSTLFGNYMIDTVAQNMPKSTVLDATYGNIELIETMLVINNLKNLFKDNNKIVGDIKVINPYLQQGVPTVDNKVLLYNFNQLTRISPITKIKNNIENDIKMVTWIDKAYYTFKEILAYIPTMSSSKAKIWQSFQSSMSVIESSINDPENLRIALNNLRDQILNKDEFKYLATLDHSKLGNEPEQQLYKMIVMALGELNGVIYYQLQDKKQNYIDDLKIWENGLQGLQMDNPGNTSSKFLNEATNIVKQAYQNIKQDLNNYIGDIRKLTQDIKDDANFGYLKEHTIGNQAKLYNKMIDTNYENDLVAVNPWLTNSGLNESETKFLKYFLLKINQNRFAKDLQGLSENEIIKTISSDIKYLKIPLDIGNEDSIVTAKGLKEALKYKLQGLAPKELLKRINDLEKMSLSSSNQIWQMKNKFDRSEDPVSRKRFIDSVGIHKFERNLEVVLLKHLYAYSEKEHINKILPSLESMSMYLHQSGDSSNTIYKNEIKYLQDFVKNKIFNQSLMDNKSKIINAYLSKFMRFTSQLTLGLSPTQIYQSLNGLWIDLGFIYTDSKGRKSFSVDDMKDAYFYVLKDIVHFGNKRTLSEAINDFYGLNDRDMNVLVDRLKTGQYSFWNMDSFLFRFASRPDYYNRLTVFEARMRGDGCWDAHSLDENGKFIYDWSKDKRYNLVAKYGLNGPTTNAEYLKQKAMYIAVAKQLILENTKNLQGELFKMGDALPKAYTNQQSSSYKDEIDWKYGFYSHEDKSLMQSTLIGGLMLQMHTYWSSKKNQYFAESGIKQRGKMEQLEIDGKKMWTEFGEDGKPTGNFTEKNTGVPFIVWQGIFQEGVILTLNKTLQSIWNGGLKHGDLSAGFSYFTDEIWNNSDENLRNAYRANLMQFQYDLTMFLILGKLFGDMLVKASLEYQKKHKNNSLSQALENTVIQLGPKLWKQSLQDFNVLDSLTGRLTSWNPFALSSMVNLVDSYSRAFFGNTRMYDAFVNSTTLTRTFKPVFTYINPKEDN